MSRLCAILSMLVLWVVAVCAQSLATTDAVSEYDRGVAMYCDGNYAGCCDVMSALLQRNDAAQYHEEAAFYASMSQARRAVERTPYLLGRYLLEYPYSLHAGEINLALGYYYYNVGEYNKAIEALQKIELETIKHAEQDDYCYRLAMCYIRSDMSEKALPLLQALIQNSPQYCDEARYLAGCIYYENGDYDQARHVLKLIHAGSIYSNRAQYLLVNIDFINNNYAECIVQCESLLNADLEQQYTTELCRIAGECHYRIGNDDRAYEYLNRYMDACPNPMRTTVYIAGILSYRARQYELAVELLGTVVGEDDNLSQNAYMHMGMAYLQLKDVRNAYNALAHAADGSHDPIISEIALYNQALCAYESNFDLFDSTLSLFEKFASNYPQSVYIDDVHTRISDLHINSRNYLTALDYIDRIKKPSNDMLKQRQQVLYMIGTECFANNRLSDAEKWFSQASNMGDYAPEYRVRSLYWLGECYYRKGGYNEAIKCYKQVIDAHVTIDVTTVALAQYNMAYCYFRQENYERACAAFELFVKQKSATNALLVDAYSRMGDCHFQGRGYSQAEKYYAQAVSYQCAGSDYALLQQAVVIGVNKNYDRKVALLRRLISDYPHSEYSAEAYSEMAATYISLKNNTNAIKSYATLIEKYPKHALARNAMLQLGALYYNIKEYDSSIKAYKKLIVQYPTSSEAKLAIDDLKSIYIELNRVQELSDFMHQQGLDYRRSELDSLTYMAAERSYMTNGDVESLRKYVTQFPKGGYAAQAYYYMGNVADAELKYDEALSCYQHSLQADPHGVYVEDALYRCGDILFEGGQHQLAVAQYLQLEEVAATSDVRRSAQIGAMRCYISLQQHVEVIAVANRVLAHSKVSPEVEQEVRYCRAQAYLAEGNVDAAYTDFVYLAQDTRNLYGAEAAYRVAQYHYDNNDVAKAEAAANEFIEKGTPHAYWLARNFILLSDIYIAKNDVYMARQYLVQLRNNYPGGNDDIVELIDKRLELLTNDAK